MRQLIAVVLFCIGIFCVAQAQVPMRGAGLGAPASGGSGCSQATTFLARTTGLSGNETTGYTNAICYWVNQSVYANIDIAYILASNNTTQAMFNLVSTSFTGSLTIGSGTFTADQGIAGDGSTTIIDTGFTPSTSGGNFGTDLNKSFVGAYVRTSDTTGATQSVMGVYTGSSNTVDLNPENGGSTGFLGSLNSSLDADSGITNANSQGNYIYYRTGASSTVIRKNESALGTGTSSSTGLPTGDICIFALPQGSTCASSPVRFTHYQIAAIVVGGGLTTTAQVDAIAHGFNLYLTAVGTNVY